PIEGTRGPLQVLVDPPPDAARENHDAGQEEGDASGYDADVRDAHPDCDDHGPRASVMLLFAFPDGLRMRHPPVPEPWNIRAAITSSLLREGRRQFGRNTHGWGSPQVCKAERPTDEDKARAHGRERSREDVPRPTVRHERIRRRVPPNGWDSG